MMVLHRLMRVDGRCRVTFTLVMTTAILNPADLAALEMHAQILRRNADKRVVIEGHCDERGTREYNLALGERRANVSHF